MEKEGLPYPRDNLEMEETYKKVLKDFVMPAYEMYAGITSPLLKLVTCGYEVYVISGRYGLISAREKIIPYEATIDNSKALKKAVEELENVFVDGYVVLTRKYCELLGKYIKGDGVAIVPKGCKIRGFKMMEYGNIFELKKKIRDIREELCPSSKKIR